MKQAMLFDIQDFCTGDGPGIRTTVFFKGCNLSCRWCHNPESQNPTAQMLYYRDKCTHCGRCERVCPNGLETCDFCGRCEFICPNEARSISGKEHTAEDVMDRIRKDAVYYKNSGGGATFSGGECMLQIDALEELLKACKAEEIHTAVDTAGHVPFDYFERILPYTDLVLYDVKCLDSAKHKRYTGVGNELILDNLKRLLAIGKPTWVRIPVIPTFNDTEEEMKEIKRFLDSCGTPERVELLPYHTLGEGKYVALGMEGTCFDVPDEEKMERLKMIFA
ncbi:MAG: glycyl-radical enzyme activating protein [Ruminococcaceae bacterium]|nr:glycyl-radical enzyme activating protein [Oscillospiraceae bacterium]